MSSQVCWFAGCVHHCPRILDESSTEVEADFVQIEIAIGSLVDVIESTAEFDDVAHDPCPGRFYFFPVTALGVCHVISRFCQSCTSQDV